MYWYQYHLPLPVVDSAKIPLTIRIPGPGASEKSVVDAVRNLMFRHEALRTLYPTDCSGVPFQLVLDRFEDPLPVRREGDGPEEVEAVFHALFDPPMDQSADLPLRLGFRMENQRVKTLVLLLNHISADGASLSVLRAELERDLGLSSRSADPRVAAERRQVKVQPSSLARQQESGMLDARNDRALRHCEDVLASAPAAQFPRFRSTAGAYPHAEAGNRYQRSSLRSSRLLLALRKTDRKSGSSVSSMLSTIFSVAVAALSGNPRVVFRTNFSNRFQELENSVGCFFQEALVSVNPLPDVTIGELMTETEHRTLVGARHAQYSYLRFRDLKARVEVQRGHPIRLGTIINCSSRFREALQGPGIPTHPAEVRPSSIKRLECLWRDEYTDLCLRSYPKDGEAILDLIGHRTVIGQDQIDRMLTGMERFLMAWADEPDLANTTVTEVVERFGLPVSHYGEGWVHIDHSWVNTSELERLIRTVEGSKLLRSASRNAPHVNMSSLPGSSASRAGRRKCELASWPRCVRKRTSSARMSSIGATGCWNPAPRCPPTSRPAQPPRPPSTATRTVGPPGRATGR
nr:condensation domain-containing protein [Streptomyces antimycoticus]